MSQYLYYKINVTPEVDSMWLNTLRIGNNGGSAMLDAAWDTGLRSQYISAGGSKL
jgi:hypothetical protein